MEDHSGRNSETAGSASQSGRAGSSSNGSPRGKTTSLGLQHLKKIESEERPQEQNVIDQLPSFRETIKKFERMASQDGDLDLQHTNKDSSDTTSDGSKIRPRMSHASRNLLNQEEEDDVHGEDASEPQRSGSDTTHNRRHLTDSAPARHSDSSITKRSSSPGASKWSATYASSGTESDSSPADNPRGRASGRPSRGMHSKGSYDSMQDVHNEVLVKEETLVPTIPCSFSSSTSDLSTSKPYIFNSYQPLPPDYHTVLSPVATRPSQADEERFFNSVMSVEEDTLDRISPPLYTSTPKGGRTLSFKSRTGGENVFLSMAADSLEDEPESGNGSTSEDGMRKKEEIDTNESTPSDTTARVEELVQDLEPSVASGELADGTCKNPALESHLDEEQRKRHTESLVADSKKLNKMLESSGPCSTRQGVLKRGRSQSVDSGTCHVRFNSNVQTSFFNVHASEWDSESDTMETSANSKKKQEQKKKSLKGPNYKQQNDRDLRKVDIKDLSDSLEKINIPTWLKDVVIQAVKDTCKSSENSQRIEDLKGSAEGKWENDRDASNDCLRPFSCEKEKQAKGFSSIPEFTSPSKLLRKITDRATNEAIRGVGSIPSFTSPSKLLEKREELDNTNLGAISNYSCEKEEQVRGFSSVPQLTSPSKLLTKITDRALSEVTQGVGSISSFTSPSKLLEKREELDNTNLGDINNYSSEKEEQVRGLGSIPQFTSPSKLLRKITDRATNEATQGVGSIPSLTSPSKLLEKREELDNTNLGDINSYSCEKEEQVRGFRSLPQLTSPSKLPTKITDRALSEVTQGVGSIPSLTSPSKLLEKKEELDNTNLGDINSFVSPSKLLMKTANREKNEAVTGVGSIPSMVSPSSILEKREQSDSSSFDYTSPSKMFMKNRNCEENVLRKGAGSLPNMVSPCPLLQKCKDRAASEASRGIDRVPSTVSPSQLLQQGKEINKKFIVTPAKLPFDLERIVFPKTSSIQVSLDAGYSTENGAEGKNEPSSLPPVASEISNGTDSEGSQDNISFDVSTDTSNDSVQVTQRQTSSEPCQRQKSKVPSVDEVEPHDEQLVKSASSSSQDLYMWRKPWPGTSGQGYSLLESSFDNLDSSFMSFEPASTITMTSTNDRKISRSPLLTDSSDESFEALYHRNKQECKVAKNGCGLLWTPGEGVTWQEEISLWPRARKKDSAGKVWIANDTDDPLDQSSDDNWEMAWTEEDSDVDNAASNGYFKTPEPSVVKDVIVSAQETGLQSDSSEDNWEGIPSRHVARIETDDNIKYTRSPKSNIYCPKSFTFENRYCQNTAKCAASVEKCMAKVQHVFRQNDSKMLTQPSPCIVAGTCWTPGEKLVSYKILNIEENQEARDGTLEEGVDIDDGQSKDLEQSQWKQLTDEHFTTGHTWTPDSGGDGTLEAMYNGDSSKETKEQQVPVLSRLCQAQVEKNVAVPSNRHTPALPAFTFSYSSSTPTSCSYSLAKKAFSVPSVFDVPLPDNPMDTGMRAFTRDFVINTPAKALIENIKSLYQSNAFKRPSKRPHDVVESPKGNLHESNDNSSRPHTSPPAQDVVSTHDPLQAPGASSPSSRGTSPTPDQLFDNDSTRRISGGPSELRSFLVEKEVIESQLRKTQMENASLMTENKLLKEKYNRAQARIAELESQLLNTQKEADHLQVELSEEMSALKRKSRDRSEQEQDELQKKIVTLTKEVEILKVENSSMEKQLSVARRSSDMSRQSSDRSLIINSYKTEINSVKEDLERVRQMLSETERDRQTEVDKRREASAQVIKLTEMKALLQQQLEQAGGGTVAEKQVKSLERRLKITEDRLHQERADRAGKLSEVEEKLINENAKLQVAEKELRRQLQREREKLRTSDTKFKEARDESERLRVSLAEKTTSTENLPYHARWNASKFGVGTRKHADDVKHVLEQIKREENLGEGQEQEIVWLLWHRKEELAKQLKEWEIHLNELKVNHGSIKEGLKIIRDERGLYEDRIKRYKESLEDTTREKEELEHSMQSKIKQLVSERHDKSAKLKNLEDMNSALKAENDSLHQSMWTASGLEPVKGLDVSTREAQVESLKSELRTVKGDLQQSQRTCKIHEGELGSLRATLGSKERALEEALEEISRLGSSSLVDSDLVDHQQHKVDKLQAEIKALSAEVHMWQEKHRHAHQERDQLEEQVTRLTKQISRGKFSADGFPRDLKESDKLALETELNEKDSQVLQLTVQYNGIENELQRAKQNLLLQQERDTDIAMKLDDAQRTLRQKVRVMERMANSEKELQAELRSVRDNLNHVNKELTSKSGELKLRMVELDREHDKVKKLEADLDKRDRMLSQNIAELLKNGTLSSILYSDNKTARETLTEAETRFRMLEFEKETLTHDIHRTNAALDTLVRENSELLGRVREIKQELVKERAQLCQTTAEKVEAEQKLRICVDERDSLQREKEDLVRDIAKQESSLKKTIQRLELENRQRHVDLQQSYQSVNAEGKRLVMEACTMKRFVEAREKEIELLQDTIQRQKGEMESLHGKIELLQDEIQISHSDIERLTNDLTNKMKENAVAVEAHQHLSSEKTKLQMEKYQLEKDIGKEKENVERKVLEINELQRKLEKTDELFRQTEKSLHLAETKMAGFETEIRHLNKNISSIESERHQMKATNERLNEEIRNLSTVNSSLEQRISFEKTTLNDEKSTHSQLREQLNMSGRQVEIIKREYDIMTANLETEKRNVERLKEQCQIEEDKCFKLEERVKNQELEIETMKGHLAETRNTVEQYKKDKQTLYQDVQDLCKKLGDKDEIIAHLEEQAQDAVDSIQRDYDSEKNYFSREKDSLESNLAQAKRDMSEMEEKLYHKETQLEAYNRTLHELEQEIMLRQEVENKLLKVDNELQESKRTVAGLKVEINSYKDQLRQMQESLDKARGNASSLKEQLRLQRDQSTKEIHELKQTLSEELHRNEIEKADINDKLNKALANLKATDVSLAATTETKDSLLSSNKTYEKSIDTLKGQLHEEIMGRKLAEQRVESLKSQLEDSRQRRAGFDDRTAELTASLAKAEAELVLEREKLKRLQQSQEDLQNQACTTEAQSQTLKIQLAELQAELSMLRKQGETQKQDLSGKNKRVSLELQQQTESYEKERSKLVMQAQQLSVDLEQVREQVALKNRENLRLQEEILSMEEKVREANTELKKTEEALKVEKESGEKLDFRNQELEIDISRLRAGLKDGDSDSARYQANRMEMNKMMSDLSRQMQKQLDTHRLTDKEARMKEYKQVEEYKKKLAALESSLSQEQAMHIVTKTQLSSLEDDNQRLRQQIQSLRKRLNHSVNADERSRSRLDEINEIIARSQTRAQQLLASGAYGEDPLRTLSPSRDFLTGMPTMPFFLQTSAERAGDPNRSMNSDDLPAFSSPNTSGLAEGHLNTALFSSSFRPINGTK